MAPKRRDWQSGFTLIELLLAASITGLILATLGIAISEGYQNASSTKTSVDRSILGSFAARYFSADVASATFGASAIVTTNPPACGTGTTVLDIQTSAISAVSYSVVVGPNGAKSFDRSFCAGTVTGTLTQTSRVHLGTSDSTLAVSALPVCTAPSSTSCSLLLHWDNPSVSITVSGTRWVNAATTTTSTP